MSWIRSPIRAGIYCKIHLFTRDGSKLKKKTKILPFSLNPTFNDTLTLSGSAKGGEMKVRQSLVPHDITTDIRY